MGNKEEVKIIRKRNQWQDEWWEPKQKKHDCMMLVTMVTTIQLLACIYIWHCIFIFSTPIFFLHVYAAAGMRQEESFKTFCESVKRHGVFFFLVFFPPSRFYLKVTSEGKVRKTNMKDKVLVKNESCYWANMRRFMMSMQKIFHRQSLFHALLTIINLI